MALGTEQLQCNGGRALAVADMLMAQWDSEKSGPLHSHHFGHDSILSTDVTKITVAENRMDEISRKDGILI